jgi:hypothetical protein
MPPVRSGRLHCSLAERSVTTTAIQIQQLDSIPVAVIRRQVKLSELSRVVPECCGLVFAAARGQQARVGPTSRFIGTRVFASRRESSCTERSSHRAQSCSRRHPPGESPQRPIGALTRTSELPIKASVVGRNRPANAWLVPIGRFTGTGSRRGMPNPPRSVRIFTTSSVRLETF